MILIIVVMMDSVESCVAAALPHFKALMALSDHSGQQHESELASSDSSHSEAGDHSRAQRTDHVVVNYGPAKAKCVHQTFCLGCSNLTVTCPMSCERSRV